MGVPPVGMTVLHTGMIGCGDIAAGFVVGRSLSEQVPKPLHVTNLVLDNRIRVK